MSEIVNLAVVGGGAAGLAAAIFAARRAAELGLRRQIVVLDGARSPGAKILISGGGRCNITHDRVGFSDYNGSKIIVRNILAGFDVPATIAWFESLGVQLKREEGGKLFPVGDSASQVVSALLRRCAQLDVRILASHRVHELTVGSPFTIRHEKGLLRAGRVIMATGGRSLPKTGSDGEGWAILRRLGHTVGPTYPALVPLLLDRSFFHAGVSGASVDVQLSTFSDGKLIDRRQGSLLWTHFGISGPLVLDASRHWIIARAEGHAVDMRCSFFGATPSGQVERLLVNAAESQSRQSVAHIIARHLPQRLAVALLRYAGIDPELSVSQLTRDLRRRLTIILTDLPLPVVGDRGWNYAEVTAGGVSLSEINYRSMESRKVPGLYLVGEMLDCDGRIGGFNFQWAWSTGYLAGVASVSSCAAIRGSLASPAEARAFSAPGECRAASAPAYGPEVWPSRSASPPLPSPGIER